jgi:hypothetical protein
MAIDVVSSVLCNGISSTPILMKRAEGARVVWVNWKACAVDYNFHRLGRNREDYERHLLEQCAFIMPGKVDDAAQLSSVNVQGWADRYGGDGALRNGGSARAAIVNGYHIKGIGRTPLLSIKSDLGHSSGEMYLEECVREAIMSEIVRFEFPHSAVPVLAIIAIDAPAHPAGHEYHAAERRALLVRPLFLRPAHFERAVGFLGLGLDVGVDDVKRVETNIVAGRAIFGEAFSEGRLWAQLWMRWARQAAYAYVHRLPHGGLSTSNLAMSGALLDFGAATACPSWDRLTLIPGGVPFGDELVTLQRGVASVHRSLSRYGDVGPNATDMHKLVRVAYAECVAFETFRMFGLSRNDAMIVARNCINGRQYSTISKLYRRYSGINERCFDEMPPESAEVDFVKIFEVDVPEHLTHIKDIISNSIPAASSSDKQACLSRCEARPLIYRESIRRDLQKFLYRGGDNMPSPEHIDKHIRTYIAMNRRDSFLKCEDLICGFAIGRDVQFVLLRDKLGKPAYAAKEDKEGPRAGGDSPRIWPIAKLERNAITIAAGGTIEEYECVHSIVN